MTDSGRMGGGMEGRGGGGVNFVIFSSSFRGRRFEVGELEVEELQVRELEVGKLRLRNYRSDN
jgi:hypothetical protein